MDVHLTAENEDCSQKSPSIYVSTRPVPVRNVLTVNGAEGVSRLSSHRRSGCVLIAGCSNRHWCDVVGNPK
jgi:hypothetical protein